MKNNQKKSLKLQADADPRLVKRFRSNCKSRKKFKGVALERLAEFWLSVDDELQDAIYNGDFATAEALAAGSERAGGEIAKVLKVVSEYLLDGTVNHQIPDAKDQKAFARLKELVGPVKDGSPTKKAVRAVATRAQSRLKRQADTGAASA